MPVPDPTRLGQDDPLSRFILSKDHFSVANNRIKPVAFMPTPEDRILSVFSTKEMVEAAVWQLGIDAVAKPRGKTLYARGDIPVREIAAAKLGVEFDNVPPRHVSVTGWPEDKSAVKSLAQELASRARLCIKPEMSLQQASS